MPGAWTIEPPKGALIDLETGEQLTFQFNPPEFKEGIGVNYARHTVPGLAFQILQYINTNNNSIPLTLYLSDVYSAIQMGEAGANLEALEGPAAGGGPGLMSSKRFLQSLAYPVRTPAGGWKAPPKVLFVWPNVIRMKCVVTNLSFSHQKFSLPNLETSVMTAEITLEECQFSQRYSDAVRRQGSQFGS